MIKSGFDGNMNFDMNMMRKFKSSGE